MSLGRIFKLLISYPLYLISKIYPMRSNLWLFGAWFGRKYFDNSKFLFEYIIKNHAEIDAKWITSDKSYFEENKDRMEVVYKYSVKGLYFSLISKVIVVTHSVQTDTIGFANNSRKVTVQLWHGIPIKKIGYDDKYGYGRKSLLKEIKNRIFPFEKDQFSLIISSSDQDKRNMVSAFRANDADVVVSGYPRNDILSEIESMSENRILYAPTLRDGMDEDIDLFSNFGFDVEKFNLLLKSRDLYFDIKMHPVNQIAPIVKKKIFKYERINLMESLMEINDKLKKYKMIVSDYSGIYIDYLLLDKPVIFAPFDLKKYLTKDRELYYDYDKVTPGPKCRNWNEVLEWIEKFDDNPRLFSKEREVVKKTFHKYQDGNNSKRVFNAIIECTK